MRGVAATRRRGWLGAFLRKPLLRRRPWAGRWFCRPLGPDRRGSVAGAGRDRPLLAGPTNLTSLYLGGNFLTNVPWLIRLPRLKLLNLDDNRIANLSPLAAMTNLAYLSLSRNPITNYWVLTNLTALPILSCEAIR